VLVVLLEETSFSKIFYNEETNFNKIFNLNIDLNALMSTYIEIYIAHLDIICIIKNSAVLVVLLEETSFSKIFYND
jgi:hypothetical protein